MITVTGVQKRFGDFAALHGVDLTVADGELVALLGPSGSGKTTLLRLIGGLLFPDAGSIAFAGEDVSAVPASQRGVGFVFQNYALFRHMTVARNVAFGLEVRRRGRPGKVEIAARVERLLELVQLPGLGGRYPAQLSGGQRQRVALARALAVEPRVLLLDEPFGALDAKVRKELRTALRELHDRTGLTTLFVTHDQEEALDLADRVAVMDGGRIAQVGTPTGVYDRPATAFVSDFLGGGARLACGLAGGHVHLGGLTFANAAPVIANGPGIAHLRAHEWRLADDGLAATVVRGRSLGGDALLSVLLDGLGPAEIRLPRGTALPEAGARTRLTPTIVRGWPV